MNLSSLLQDLGHWHQEIEVDLDVSLVTHDSRKVIPGALFVAVTGFGQDGHDFIAEAEKKGAVAVVVEREVPSSLPQLRVPSSRAALAIIAARFFDHPSLKMNLWGITGTNGKTTMTYVLESILKAAGRHVGVIGTIESRYAGKSFPASHTTPESIELQRLLSAMLVAGVTDVVMEVSSHALSLDRVKGVHFNVVGFTNLSQDHLDYHQDMNSYFEAKTKLFNEVIGESQKKAISVINTENDFGRRLTHIAKKPFLTCSLNQASDVVARDCRMTTEGIHLSFEWEGKSCELNSSLLGQFNMENILLGSVMALSQGIPAATVSQGIADLSSVPGRLEKIGNSRDLLVFVDYAHTPEALEKVIAHLKTFGGKKLITVFGCGGDRDAKKRPIMGKIAADGSDWVVLTSDNPRTENPDTIMDEIAVGIRQGKVSADHVVRLADRAQAIEAAVHLAGPGDIILVAGKGHEDYQIIGTKKFPFSDQEVLRRSLGVTS